MGYIKASNGKVGLQAESDRNFPDRWKHEDKTNGNTGYKTPVTKMRDLCFTRALNTKEKRIHNVKI